MAYLNKDEATKAFEIAIENLGSGKYEEALISAYEARLMNPELPGIKRLVTLLQVLSADPDTTHYGILGVEETANENEIRLAYRKLAVDLNPNTNHFPKVSEAFRRISEAMRVLSSDRLKYDNDLAATREDCAIVAELEAKNDALHGKDFIGDHGALPWAAAVSEATFGKYSVISPERRAHFRAIEALHGRDFLVDREARARAVPGFKAVFGKDVVDAPEHGALFDVVVAPKRGALFDVFEAYNVSKTIHGNGMISSRELQAAYKAYNEAAFNVFETNDGMISSSDFLAAFKAYDEEPQSTTHHPSKKRFVCSSNEVDGVVAPERGAPFDVGEAFNVFKTIHGNGMISSSELEAAFKAFDEEAFNVFETNDGMISSSELRAAFEAFDEEPQSTTHHPSQKGIVCSSGEVAGRGTKRSHTTQATLTHPVPKKKMDGQSPLFFK